MFVKKFYQKITSGVAMIEKSDVCPKEKFKLLIIKMSNEEFFLNKMNKWNKNDRFAN